MPSHQIELLFLDLALILLLARGLGTLAARIGQPPVVGEIVAGIVLGPTLLDGDLAEALFPSDVKPLLTALASVGVALFMFTIGLEIEHQALRGAGRLTAGAAIGSTVLPFLLGIGMAAGLLRDHAGGDTAVFTVFVGLSVSVTAFPVLARILADRRLSTTSVGNVALATAAVVDVVAWVALAAVQAVAGGGSEHWRVALVVPFTAALVLLVRPLLRRVLLPGGRVVPLGPGRLVVVLTAALLCGAATEAMNLHYIFGAFLLGVVVPRDAVAAALRATIHERTTQITGFLMPVYFVVSGLDVDLGGLGPDELADLAAILTVAVAGKFAGTYLGARSQGMPGRPAAALASLMNTRGLTELIILGVGLQLGLLDGTLYSLMVAMAVLTTALTGPLLTIVLRKAPDVPAPDVPAPDVPAVPSRPEPARAPARTSHSGTRRA
ncbi:cation:proton antiporter [Streptomyces actinomycinicus]|uniref:Cation:proton antiporter n=1 Tax=Streptomyces actinomycinicus TaxID=1695166 RepID=A0A937EPZ3_9ACTN|nr:cation:proton antiporter [Streptomyces actinomycinicus]MBL1087412.1 cation:proton antiporter [Streptomyces actinomycinicus]